MKLDKKLTESLQRWLDTPDPQKDIRAGADMMLSLNRNRALYNSILKHPAKFLPKLIYELRKYLKIRLANMTSADVARMQQDVLPRVEAIVSQPPVITPDDEFPSASKAHGRRADHNTLPPEIRNLWDSNLTRYRKIQLLYNECKAMTYSHTPCDLFTQLSTLDAAEREYRKNLELYDSYIPGTPLPADVVATMAASEVVTDNSRTIGNARKTLSKYRAKLSRMAADDPRRAGAVEKIQAAAHAIVGCGGSFSPSTMADLADLGITLG